MKIMSMISRRAFRGMFPAASLAVALGMSVITPNHAAAQAGQSMPAPDFKMLASALRGGGLVILVRHGATFSNQADTNPFDLADTSKQRNLNDKGKDLARQFGANLRDAGVPVGEVYTSQFNRAYETAVVAGFKDIKKSVDLSEGGLVVSPDENNRRAKALLTMLGHAPEKGKNDILVTHKPNIGDALGKDWFDVKEGEASIFRPENGKYSLVGRVQMEDWSQIATVKK